MKYQVTIDETVCVQYLIKDIDASSEEEAFEIARNSYGHWHSIQDDMLSSVACITMINGKSVHIPEREGDPL